MAIPFSKLTQETLSSLAETNFKSANVVKQPKKNLISDLSEAADNAGIRELSNMLNNLELHDVCNRYLQVEHSDGSNQKSKMLLSKRLKESIEESGLEEWFNACDDKKVLKIICGALSIELAPKANLPTMKKQAVEHIRKFGAEILLNRMRVSQLKDCCREMKLKGWEDTTSQRSLVNAILTQSNVVVKQQKPKVITKKLPIEKCTTYDEIFQHYPLKALEMWCDANKLPKSGTKKVLIERILEHLSGDKENIVVVPAEQIQTTFRTKAVKQPAAKKTKAPAKKAEVEAKPARKAPASRKAKETPKPEPVEEMEISEEEISEEKPIEKPKAAKKHVKKAQAPKKAAAKKQAAKPVEESEEEEEEEIKPAKATKSTKTTSKASKVAPPPKEESEQEEDFENQVVEPAEDYKNQSEEQEEAEQPDIDAERALRTSESESLELEDDDEEEDEENHPRSLEGLAVSCYGKDSDFSRPISEMAEAIEKAGGTYLESLKKNCNILVANPKIMNKLQKSVSKKVKNCRVVDESFLKNIL